MQPLSPQADPHDTSRFAQLAALCLVTTMAAVTVHELVHIAAGHALGMGGHFTGLTSADADAERALAVPALARAGMAGSAPLFTALTGIGALFAAPWARRRQFHHLATMLGWLAIFGVPYIGVQFMILGGPGGGVDTAAVLVGYFAIGGTTRAVLAVGGVLFTIGAGYLLGPALGDSRPAASAVLDASVVSTGRRVLGSACTVLSIGLIGAGVALLARSEPGNPMGAFLLANVLWAVGRLITTPWRQPGPQFVRDTWLAPAVAAMALLTVVGIVFPSDYAAAGVFFLPQLVTAAYAARNQEFHGEPAMMHRTRTLRAIAVILLSIVASGSQSVPAALSESLRAHVKDDRFDAVTSIRGFPLGVRSGLQSLFGSFELDIAEPGAKFQVTGATANPPLPIRRLIAGGCSTDHCLVHYERGGTAHTWHVALFHWTPAATRFEWGGIAPGQLATIDDIRKAVLSGAIKSSKEW